MAQAKPPSRCATCPKVAGCRRFINADLIAARLSPLAPERELAAAGRLFLRELELAIQEREDFAFETTLAGRTYLRLVDRLRAEGWRVELIYIALPSAELSRQRVAERVAHGGHDIPSADIERRFPRSLHNLLEVFAARVNHVSRLMNNSGAPEPVFEQTNKGREIQHAGWFAHLLQESVA